MSPNVAPTAGKPEGQSGAAPEATVITAPDARCSLLYALSVAGIPKCPSSLEKVSRYIAANATTRSGQPTGANTLRLSEGGRDLLLISFASKLVR